MTLSAPSITPPVCIHCGSTMVLRATTKFRYRNGSARSFWACPKFPDCNCTVGAHPDGRPVGFPCDEETKQARIRAHDAFDRLWKEELGGLMTRNGAYRLAQRLMGMSDADCHIGMFNAAQCELLIKRLARVTPRSGGGM